MKFLLPLALFALASSVFAADAPFYVGTYTRPNGSKGIHRGLLNLETGKISGLTLVAEAKNPSFVAIHPSGKYLYAVSEEGNGEALAYAIAADGSLKLLNKQSSKGGGTCHVTVDPAGKNILVASYGSGTVAVLPIKEDGSLGEATGFDQHTGSSVNQGRQKEPHAHAFYTDPAGKFAYSCDLGTDNINGYQFDSAKGTITPDATATGKVPAGSGPRHLAFHPKLNTVYVINELTNTVTTFHRDAATGALTAGDSVPTLPSGGKGSTAEIFTHPNGKFLYGSNRGADSITTFGIGPDGKLSSLGQTPAGVKAPRSFALDPTAKWMLVAGQDSNDIVVFHVDANNGKPTSAGQKVEVGAPVCIMFMPK
jgi:6-phosphogluconolactonase